MKNCIKKIKEYCFYNRKNMLKVKKTCIHICMLIMCMAVFVIAISLQLQNVNAETSSGIRYVTSYDTVVLDLKGTDNNYLSNSLTKEAIVVKVGGTIVTPTTKELSSPINITNGVQYKLTLVGLTGNGVLSVEIAENTLKDKVNQQNVTKIFDAEIIVDNNIPTITSVTAVANSENTYKMVINADDMQGSGVDRCYISSTNDTRNFSFSGNSLTINDILPGTTYNIYITDKKGNKSVIKTLTTEIINYSVDDSIWVNTLSQAVNATSSTKQSTIKVLRDVTDSSNASVISNVALNLNEKTISKDSYPIEVTETGELTINGNGNYNNMGITNRGKLTLMNVSIQETEYSAVGNYGYLKIEGTSNLSSTSDANTVIYNQTKGTVEITGGTITSEACSAINNYGNIKVGGTANIKSTDPIGKYPTLYNQTGGIAEITGGIIISEASGAINNYGHIKVGGTANIKSTDPTGKYTTLFNQAEGTVEITEGTIISQSGSAINNNGNLKVGGTANIKSTASSSKYTTLYNATGGIVEITGGTITSETSNAINNYGNLKIGGTTEISSKSNVSATVYNEANAYSEITGGTITGINMFAISNDGKMKISGDATIEVPVDTNEYAAVRNLTGGTIEIIGGSIKTKGGVAVGNYGNLKIGGSASIISTSTGTYSGLYNYGSTEMSSGVIQGNYHAVTNYGGGTYTMTGGTLTSPNGCAILNKGNANIKNAKLQSTAANLQAIFVSENGNTRIERSTITGTYGSIYTRDNGYVAFINCSVSTGIIGNNIFRVDTNANGYTFYAYEYYSSYGSIASLPTWTAYNGQDDLKWYTTTLTSQSGNANAYYANISKSGHNNETTGYITHVYAPNSVYVGAVSDINL